MDYYCLEHCPCCWDVQCQNTEGCSISSFVCFFVLSLCQYSLYFEETHKSFQTQTPESNILCTTTILDNIYTVWNKMIWNYFMPFSFCHAFLKEQETGNDGMSKVTSQTQTVTCHIKLDHASIYSIHIFRESHRVMNCFWPMKTGMMLAFSVDRKVKNVKFLNATYQGRLAQSYSYSLRQVQWYLCTWTNLSVLSAILVSVVSVTTMKSSPYQVYIYIPLHSAVPMSHLSKCDRWCGCRGMCRQHAWLLFFWTMTSIYG